MSDAGSAGPRLSSSLQLVVEHVSDPITAAGLVGAVLERHPEYGGGRGGAVRLDPRLGASAPATVWTDLVRSRSDEAASPGLDGRRLILGLARLDQRLARELGRGGFLGALADELDARSLAVAATSAIPAVPTAGGRWRNDALLRAAELSMLASSLRPQTGEADAIAFDLVDAHLDAARSAARDRKRGLRAWFTGSDFERAESNLEAAEVELLRVAPLSYLQSQLPGILAAVQGDLARDDPRRRSVEVFARRTADQPLKEYERETVVTAARGARSEGRRRQARLRSFRNVLLVATLMLTIAAIGLGVFGIADEEAVPLCFTATTEVVCPTDANPLPVSTTASGELEPAPPDEVDRVTRATTSPWDFVLVELVGLLAAALAAAASLRHVRGTSTPYSLPVALAALKLPTGALTAVLGILLLRAGFVPGLSALESSAQILAWGIVFGYAQQLFTRFVDQQAGAVLADAGDFEPRAAPEATAVTPETLATAVAAVRTSLAAPSLINYDGFLSVRLLDSGGRRVDDGEGRVALLPDAAYVVEVTIDRAARPDARSAGVSVQQGETAEVVPFGVELDSDLIALRGPEQDVPVAAAGDGRTVEYPLVMRTGMGAASVWVRLTQHGRLIQRIGVELELRAPVR